MERALRWLRWLRAGSPRACLALWALRVALALLCGRAAFAPDEHWQVRAQARRRWAGLFYLRCAALRCAALRCAARVSRVESPLSLLSGCAHD